MCSEGYNTLITKHTRDGDTPCAQHRAKDNVRKGGNVPTLRYNTQWKTLLKKKQRHEENLTNKSSTEFEIQEYIHNVLYTALSPAENQVKHVIHTTHLPTDPSILQHRSQAGTILSWKSYDR